MSLRDDKKRTGEKKGEKAKKADKLPDPTDGDCRECAFYMPPASTGKSEDWKSRTDNWRMRPCGRGMCVGKEFMSKKDFKEVVGKNAGKDKDKDKDKDKGNDDKEKGDGGNEGKESNGGKGKEPKGPGEGVL